jgi:hypothetical protein
MESLNEDLRFKIIAAAIYDVAVYEFEQVEAVLVSLCTALSTSALRPCLETAHRLSYEINFGKGWTLDALGLATWRETFRTAYAALMSERQEDREFLRTAIRSSAPVTTGVAGPRFEPSRALLRCRTVVIAQLVLARGANVNYRSQQAESPLRSAVERRDIEVASFLVERGATTTQRVFDTTLLHLAAERPTFDADRDHRMIRLLTDAMPVVELNLVLNQWDLNGRLPIHAAVVSTSVGAVHALLELSNTTRTAVTTEGENARALLMRVRTAALLTDDGGAAAAARLARVDAIVELLG